MKHFYVGIFQIIMIILNDPGQEPIILIIPTLPGYKSTSLLYLTMLLLLPYRLYTPLQHLQRRERKMKN